MDEHNRLPDDAESSDSEAMKKDRSRRLSSGMGLGVALGLLIGLLIDNLALGVAIGIVFGAAYGTIQWPRPSNTSRK